MGLLIAVRLSWVPPGIACMCVGLLPEDTSRIYDPSCRRMLATVASDVELGLSTSLAVA